MRPVYFVKYYDKGSTVMGADQISEALRDAGVESRSVYPRDVAAISDAVLIFIKTSRWDHLAAARRRRNRLVLDVQDTVVFKRRIKNAWAFDGVIFKNARQLQDFGSPRRIDRVIYHQWDPRYRPHAVRERTLRVGYFGLARSFPLWGRVPGVDCFDADYFRHALDYNCHFSTREPGRDALYKPNCKISTAAACDAGLVTTPDESSIELLGADYPYYTASDAAAIANALGRARETFEGPAWRDARDRLQRVKARTSLPSIRDDYVRYVRDLG
jgi:hypothetical protein